jgi:hypothetical protein
MKKRLKPPSKKNGNKLQSSIFEFSGQERVTVMFLPEKG